jgi:transcriptional regulator with XRE-family HTH domain
MIAVPYSDERPNTKGAEQYPDVATTPYWCGLMYAARKALKLTQTDIARRVGTSQTTITNLEKGVSKTSRWVHPVSELLRIPLPYAMIGDDWERRWIEAGRRFREANEEAFKTEVQGVERMADTLSRGKPGREH